jgi:hypothetical protein
MTPNYDNLTNDELLRYADGQAGLIKALAERLEMCMRELEERDRPKPIGNDQQLNLF